MPKFSIIIPCHNAERFIAEAISSCLQQSEKDLEVIVIDDGSTDGSRDVVAGFLDDKRVILVEQEQAGVAAARNAGIRRSSGDYLNFLDADDFLHPAKLEKQGRILDEDTEVGVVLCDGCFVDESGLPKRGPLLKPERFRGMPELFDVLFRGGQFPPHVPILRRTLALKAGGFDDDPEAAGWADTGFWLRVARRSPRYALVDEPLCSYRVHDGAMSRDIVAMENAARRVYSSTMAADPIRSAAALRHIQRCLEDLETSVWCLRQALNRETRSKFERPAGALSATLALAAAISQDPQAARALVIWGAGSGGRRVLALVEEYGGVVKAFVDSDPSKSGSYINGVAVINPQQLPERAYIVVSSIAAAAIELDLKRMSLERWRDYVVVDFDAVAVLEEELRDRGILETHHDD